MDSHKTWHRRHADDLSFGDRIADKVASGMGSWRFIIVQSIFVLLWMLLNIVAYASHWDPYPFILLNLLFSTQAAYAAPIIMMAQNRQGERDRHQAMEDYRTNVEAKKELEDLQRSIAHLEVHKLDRIIDLLEGRQRARQSQGASARSER